MNWVRKRNLLVVEAIKYKNWLCLEINNLWHTLYSTFNLVQDHNVDFKILKEIPNKALKEWSPFLREKVLKVITKCNNSSASRPDKLL